MSPPLVLLSAYLLDQLLGDPQFRLHPVRLIGDVAELWRRPFFPLGRLGGLLTLFATILIVVEVVSILTRHIPCLEPLFLYFFVVERALREEALKVCRALEERDLSLARHLLSFIVGRETKTLSPSECVRAAVETVAENFADGFVGPVFYYLLGGLPLAAAYKVVETLDSMYGYRTARWSAFGFFPAKADDVLNFLPARLAGFFLVLAAAVSGLAPGRALRTMFRDARKHDSPNAGWPEAAVAGALDIGLGGPVIYHGVTFEKGRLGEPLREREALDIKRAVSLLRRASFLFILTIFLLEVFLWKSGYPHLIGAIGSWLGHVWTT